MPETIIRKLLDTLDKAVQDFNESIPGIQREIAAEIEIFVKDLDTTGDTIKSSVANLRKIAAFKDRIYSIIRRSGYDEKVNEFVKAFNEVAVIQNQYFTKLSADFKPTKLLEEIKKQSISAVIDDLTESGLHANIINPIQDILVTNSTTGGSWSKMVQQIRDFIVTNKVGDGRLERYAKQITNGALNNFAGQYMNAVTNDLGLKWKMYDGGLIESSRPFCKACTKKKYLHEVEFEDLLAGDFPEFKEADGVIYEKTGLPTGLQSGTTPENFQVYAGGHDNNCRHQVIPVSNAMVPLSVRKKLFEKYGVPVE